MRKINSKTGAEMFVFDSMTDVVSYINPNLFEKHRASFIGEELNTWDSVQERSRSDWEEGMEILHMYIDRLSKIEIPKIKSHKRKTTFNETDGDEMDYDRMREGQAFWRKSEREETHGPTTVTIVIDTTTAASQDVENILWRGAAAVALTQLLEVKGYSVELWVVNGSNLYDDKPGKSVQTACCLKRCSDPLDSSTLINTVAGWFYRTVTFTVLHTICRKEGHKEAYGLGSCSTPTQDDLDNVTTDELRIYSSGVFSFSGAASVVTAELKRIGERRDTETKTE